MKLGKFSGAKAANALGTAAGVGTGMLLSNGLSHIIPMENKTAVKGIVTAFGVAGMILFSGDGTVSKIAKDVSMGVAVQQTKELAKEFITPHLPDGNGAVTKFINASFENDAATNAPVNVKRLASPHQYMMRMANPSYDSKPVGGGFQAV